ncbi:MAG TPA: sugar transferase [Candidatus Didemnitutus sp.]|nr:sugar transferase [Candidatus Didemnitutus sp.]
MARAASNSLRETKLPLLLLAGDTVVVLASLVTGYVLRYRSPLGALGIDVPDAHFGRYLPLVLLGAVFLVGAFAQQGLYDGRLLLRKRQSLSTVLRATAFWLVAYLAFSLVIKFDPPISRLFVVLAAIVALLAMWIWRELFYFVLTRPAVLPLVQRRVAILGWNGDAAELAAELHERRAHPYRVVGVVTLPGAAPLPAGQQSLGDFEALADVLAREYIDVLIAATLDLPRADLQRATELCENAYVEWKVIPSAFQIFVSGLTLQSIGSIPVLGVEDLAINRLLNRAAKRIIDVFGAAFGLLISLPVIALLALAIKRESPGGPVFFGQRRVGAGHRPFTLYKLRSMVPDAAATDDRQQSTRRGDPRLLRIGTFMRRWNLDELPQYWNVLCGHMSLVGPRPERPAHVDQLSAIIPHYLPRHLVKPGMTGWAQVHGLRGASDLNQRARYDIYYIENWSLWLDLQIMMLTFVRWRAPA